MKSFMKFLDVFAFTLLIVGGLNWGLVGFWNINIIGLIFQGDMSLVSRIIYAAVGVAALYGVFEVKMMYERWTHTIEAHAHS
jgi:uncharacterized membrane protein YuzA (DUF378 family)